ncbi:MAG: hypothetical protein AAFU73_00115 [Planctomycetota bacterium]
MGPARVAHLAGALPAVGTAAGFVVASWSGDIDPVNPFTGGEVSISRAMRNEPAVQVFRAFVLPSAALMALTWVEVGRALRAGGVRRGAQRWTVGLGVLGAVFLVLYGSYLGTDGDVYRLMRRYGVYVFFGGTGIALTLAAVAWPSARAPRARRSLRLLAAGLWAAGPVQLVHDHVVGRSDVLANALEWWIAAALMLGFALLGALVGDGSEPSTAGASAPTEDDRVSDRP